MTDAFADALNFPHRHNPSLDALEDSLSDVAVWAYGADPAATGLALLLQHYDAFAAKEPRAAHLTLDIFERTARNGALVGHRMMCLVQSDDPNLQFPPVGATSVTWASGFSPWPLDETGAEITGHTG